ncbi:hypothetical protein DPEC_G00103610 [Dallia pectoralis]|uniref:Uncharacterized protein n=1 Tax=Dallia pectoralis TaxID=75939 RepID=A0ACC2GY25_DALPE|nr:hypothetical protein DPEC_G00103610 [Dallia pectoralis]
MRDRRQRMTDKSKCTTIYMSRELRRVSDNNVLLSTGGQETRFTEYTSPASLRVNNTHSHHRSLGIRRSFGSTDLLANAHPQSAHSALSLDSLEGVPSLHADSKMELQAAYDPDLKPRTSQSSRLSLDAVALCAAGEGRGSDRKRSDCRDNCLDAKGSSSETACPENDEDPGSSQYVEEEEDQEEGEEEGEDQEDEEDKEREEEEKEDDEEEGEEDSGLPKACNKTRPDVDVYLQEFHSLPKRLVPSEITHCLYELEEECRGVERESESVKWKMELIHGSVQTVQETLRTLLKRLVEAQSSRAIDPNPKPTHHHIPSTHHHIPSTHHHSMRGRPHFQGHTSHAPSCCHTDSVVETLPSPSQILAAGAIVSQENEAHSQCTHHHCLAVARRPSETCLTEPAAPGTPAPCHCCPKTTSPGTATVDTTSCAQRGKERAAALHAISELRMDVERLRVAHEEGRQEARETLELLRAFQKDMGTLVSHCPKNKQDKQKWGSPMAKLEALRKQSKNLSEMTRQAVSVFGKVGLHVDERGTEAPQVPTDPPRLTPNRCSN